MSKKKIKYSRCPIERQYEKLCIALSEGADAKSYSKAAEQALKDFEVKHPPVSISTHSLRDGLRKLLAAFPDGSK